MNVLAKTLVWFSGALALVLAAGCGSAFDPAARVTDFRLIAVAVDKPYAAPGEEVKVTTLVHEPFGRPVQWAWLTCEDPRDTTVNACFAKIAEDARAGKPPAIALGPDPSFTWRVPADALSRLPAVVRPSATAGIVTIGCPGRLEQEPFNNAGSDQIPFRCIEAGSEQILPYERWVVSVKRVFLRERDRNALPGIAEVTWNGASWPEGDVRETRACNNDSNAFDDCDGGEQNLVAARPSPEAIERGVDEYGLRFSEQVVVQAYATEGNFEFEARTVETAALGSKWVARKAAKGKEIVMWFVIRDNRGGVSWTSRRVRVRA